jgi:hypothetical protein
LKTFAYCIQVGSDSDFHVKQERTNVKQLLELPPLLSQHSAIHVKASKHRGNNKRQDTRREREKKRREKGATLKYSLAAVR